MPTSRPDHLSHLCKRIIDLQPTSILDIGCGFGSKGVLFREYTDIWNLRYESDKWMTKIYGLEPYERYHNPLHRYTYDKVLTCRVEDVDLWSGHYHLIYIGDVMEHLTRDVGITTMEICKRRGDHLWIATPLKMSKQGKLFNNPGEIHVTQWYVRDFEERGFVTEVFGNTLFAEWSRL